MSLEASGRQEVHPISWLKGRFPSGVTPVTWWLPLLGIKCKRTGIVKEGLPMKRNRDLLAWKAPSSPDAKQG